MLFFRCWFIDAQNIIKWRETVLYNIGTPCCLSRNIRFQVQSSEPPKSCANLTISPVQHKILSHLSNIHLCIRFRFMGDGTPRGVLVAIPSRRAWSPERSMLDYSTFTLCFFVSVELFHYDKILQENEKFSKSRNISSGEFLLRWSI